MESALGVRVPMKIQISLAKVPQRGIKEKEVSIVLSIFKCLLQKSFPA
jgi:hypothetical protein